MNLRWLTKNIRTIIYSAALLIALLILVYLRQHISLFSLLKIRLTEYYAFTALAFLYLTLLISPLYKVFPKIPQKGLAIVARRALGVSTFFFATLHASFAFFGLLGGFAGLKFLGTNYLVSITLGFSALCILAILAATSFDFMIRWLGRKWKAIHKLVYAAGFLVIIHFVAMGSSFVHPSRPVPALIFTLITALFILQSIRIYLFLRQRYIIIAPYALVALLGLSVLFMYFAIDGHITHYLGLHVH